jgi:transcriptional regulator with GAF, ATPase, and Fis domain
MSSSTRLRIVISPADGDDGEVVPLGDRVITLGRSADAEVKLAEPLASRVHCQLEPTGDGWKLVDLESQNGTAVNGDRVNQKMLQPGDTITIGDTDIVFEADPASGTDDMRMRGARRGLRRLRGGRGKRRRGRSQSVTLPEGEGRAAESTPPPAVAKPAVDPDALEAQLIDALEAIRRGYGEEGLIQAEKLFREYTQMEGRGELESLRARADQIQRLLAVAKALNSELNLKRLLNLIMDSVIELTNAERGFLLLLDDEGDGGKAGLKVQVARNFDRESVRNPSFKISRSIAQQVARDGEPIISTNAQDDPRFTEYMSVSDLRLRSLLSAPLKIRDKVVGVVYIDNRFEQGVFTEVERTLLAGFCDQAAVAIQNAQLLESEVERGKELATEKEKVEQLNARLEKTVEVRTVELADVRKDLAASRKELELKYNYDKIVGRASAMQKVFQLLDRITDSDVPVLIQGESGTGKELVAHAIHFNGPRKKRRFVSENCAAIPETLLESELFGHVRGAFTGAVKDKTGLFEEANGGTLFLDEIGDMPLDMQKKLLRALQEGEIRRVGGKSTTKVDVRIISASNRDLRQMLRDDQFREDLFYRLNVVTVYLPPLRERRDDIPLLVDHFLGVIAAETRSQKAEISPPALALLMAYDWPGNVRELENEVRRAVALAVEGVGIGPDELSPEVRGDGSDRAASYIGRPLKDVVKEATEEVERVAIQAALEMHGWNKVKTSAALGISRPTLDSKIDSLGLTRDKQS